MYVRSLHTNVQGALDYFNFLIRVLLALIPQHDNTLKCERLLIIAG